MLSKVSTNQMEARDGGKVFVNLLHEAFHEDDVR